MTSPHHDREAAVLGALLEQPSSIPAVAGLLDPVAFTLPVHRRIFEALLAVHGAGGAVDPVTVGTSLAPADAVVMSACLDAVFAGSPARVLDYARSVAVEVSRVELCLALSSVADEAREAPQTELPELIERARLAAAEAAGKVCAPSSAVRLKDMAAAEVLDVVQGTAEGLVLPTGMAAFDRKFGGLLNTFVVTAGYPGMGKCLGRGTMVMLYNGQVAPAETIVVGDLLMGPDSQPREVLSTTRGRAEMFVVKQNRGVDYRVNGDHVLSLMSSRDRRGCPRGTVTNITIKEYLKKGAWFMSNNKGYKVPVQFRPRPVPVEPYFLGVWLGDGNSRDVRVTAFDDEIVEYMAGYADRLGLRLGRNGGHYSIAAPRGGLRGSAVPLQTKLRRLRVLGDKHIPHDYIQNEEGTRLELLAGLLDSDGHYSDQYNCFEITQKNKVLANQIKLLADTLGFVTSINAKTASIKDRGYTCEVFRVRISGELHRIPCRVERKKARRNKRRYDRLLTGIAVAPDGVDDYFGFELDGDGLFLLGDCTATHNSTYLINLALNVAAAGKRVIIMSMEDSRGVIVDRMIARLAGLPAFPVVQRTLNDEQRAKVLPMERTLKGLDILIDDRAGRSSMDLRADLMRHVDEHGADLVLVDHLGKIRDPGKSLYERASAASGALADMQKELGCPLVAAHQMSRRDKGAAIRMPAIDDLRDSGWIEADARMIVMLHRPHYYFQLGATEEEPSANDISVIVGKNTSGPTGVSPLYCDMTQSYIGDHPAKEWD